MENCEVIAAVAGAVPVFNKEEFGVSIYYANNSANIDLTWRASRWLWVLRNKGHGKIKGCGYCDTAAQALKMAFTAAAFYHDDREIARAAPIDLATPEPEAPPEAEAAPEPKVEIIEAAEAPVAAPVAANGRHYRAADVRFSRA